MDKRSANLDYLKAIAIIAVILYHLGVSAFAYLGVEIFLVVGGFLMMKSILRRIEENTFSFRRYAFDRLARLWPLLLLVCVLSLGFGFFTMLPDDFENLGISVIATETFANNIISCLTTGNYWDVVNDYKPLMHTWYTGLLMQGYVVLALFSRFLQWVGKGKKTVLMWGMVVLTAISCSLYILPLFSDSQKFYFLPCRLFEITLGCCLAFVPKPAQRPRWQYAISVLLSVILLGLCFLPVAFVPAPVRLCLTVAVTGLLLVLAPEITPVTFIGKGFALLGKASYSLFIWHQPILAFTRYCVCGNHISGWWLVLDLALTVGLSFLSYRFLEQKLAQGLKTKKGLSATLLICLAVCILSSGAAGIVYLKSGVVRDVPELGIEAHSSEKVSHSTYCDRVYQWDKDFSSADKVKVLVVGDSFARDWANILAESTIADQIEISYIYPHSNAYVSARHSRFEQANLVFWATYGENTETPSYISANMDVNKLYVVGVKNFGECNGVVYQHRRDEDYLESRVAPSVAYYEQNKRQKTRYEEKYIDLLALLSDTDNCVPVFTPDGHFISQDCRHLTQYGAQYFAQELDLNWIVL